MFGPSLGRSAATVVCLAAAALIVPTVPAFGAAQNGTSHCDLSNPTCGIGPVLTGPPPPFVSIPANCPAFLSSDQWILNFVSGSAVFHGTSNKNGDWGGFTEEGQGQLTTSDSTVQYAGHLTVWGGGGNNSGGQTENGFTVDFHGSGIAGNFSLHVNSHMTTNNGGQPTANATNVLVTCS